MEQLNTDHYRPLRIIDKLSQQNDIFQPNLDQLSPVSSVTNHILLSLPQESFRSFSCDNMKGFWSQKNSEILSPVFLWNELRWKILGEKYWDNSPGQLWSNCPWAKWGEFSSLNPPTLILTSLIWTVFKYFAPSCIFKLCHFFTF